MAYEMPTKWPMVTNALTRDTVGTNAAGVNKQWLGPRLVNCFAEKDPVSGDWYICKRPGYKVNPLNNKPGTGRGIYTWQGNIWSIFGGTLYRANTNIGAVSAANTYSFQEILSAPRLLAMINGGAAYYTDGAVRTQIVDPDFPANNLRHFAYLDGTLYVLDDTAVIHGSDINNPAAWSALNIISANNEPGVGRALAKQLTYVLALKEWNTEVFYDAGNPVGSPLGRVAGALLPYGCTYSGSVAEADGALLWVASNKQAEPRVIRLDNLNMQVISTPDISRILAPLAPGAIMEAFIVKLVGHRFYVLQVAELDFSLVYDLDYNLWYIWTDYTGNNKWPFVSSTRFNADTVVQHVSDGFIYTLGGDYLEPDDDGNPFMMDIYTPNFDANIFSRKKHLSRLTVEADMTVGYGETVANQRQPTRGTPGVLQIRHNDYDFNEDKWTNFRPVDLNQKNPSLNNCGTFRRRSYNLRYYGPTGLRIKNLHLQMALCTL